MKKLYIYSAITILLLLSIMGCTQKEETQIPVPTFKTTFTAVMEEDNGTKALLGDSAEDGFRELLWEPEDSIKIYLRTIDYVASYTGNIFVNTETANTTKATFEGDMYRSYDLLAIYPHNIYTYITSSNEDYYSTISIPSIQTYRENNISKDAVPMVAYKNLEGTNYMLQGDMEFRNLCGVLVLNLTGEDIVRSITITAKDTLGNMAPLSGFADIKRTAEDYYTLKMREVAYDFGESGASCVTLECPDVQLNTETATPFHIALPPGNYSSFQLNIATAEGKIMFVESMKPLVINRSKIKHTVPLTYTETIPLNLSERGTSNSYIVSEAGIYSFDASVIGNGTYGISEYGYTHTTDVTIEPSSVEVLWMDRSGIISNTTYNAEEKTISFISTGIEGNVLLAAKDSEGKIIWSWHIWCTDAPADHTYVNDYGVFSVQDRNLGAIRADKGTGEQWRESVGTLYQWGRKDPMVVGLTSTTDTQFSIEESIENPILHASENWWFRDTGDNSGFSTLWLTNFKTIYDPCPLGYRVAPIETFRGFTVNGETADRIDEYNVSGTFDKGWNFKYDGTNTAWYPVTPEYIYCDGWTYSSDNSGFVRTSSFNNSLYYSYSTDLENNLNYDSGNKGDALPLRCMKDEGYTDTSLPTVMTGYATSIITTGATLKGNVTSAGESDVVSRGFVWSTEHMPTTDLETKVEVEGTDGEFEYKLTGLNTFTTYYVRAYATNSHGTAYGKEISFTTLYTGAITDLSIHGTANCYMVTPEEAHYSIDASIIGNGVNGIIADAGFHTSNPSISPASIKILWQDAGHPIDFADFHREGCFIHFHTNGAEGNAVIGAMDENGTILWSWHIWVTDTPQEQSFNGYIVMDRNIGAIMPYATSDSDLYNAAGLMFQWGRKDPFGYGSQHNILDQQFKTIDESIEQPTSIAVGDYWLADDNSRLWDDTTKTIYDPCPVGWKVSNYETWTDVKAIGSENYYITLQDYMEQEYNYPYNMWRRDNWGNLYSTSDCGEMWTNRHRYTFRYNIYQSVSYNNRCPSDSYVVRCIKDESYVDAAIPSISIDDITNITTSSADIKCMVSKQGGSEISSRGLLFGQTPELTLENSEAIISEGGTGEFTITLTELNGGTKYYVRAFAANEFGTAYSKVINFTTEYGGTYINLSTFETANSYIVSTANKDYCFNASVKGNSNISIGTPASAEVIWETKNSLESVTQCEIIKEVSLDGVFVTFSLSEISTSGNALIAVKDSDGNILWSWHIWVTDFDPKATAQTYISGAVMMDRNLGALSNTPGSFKSFGLMYQWGRKDPFVSAGDESGTWAVTYPENAINALNYDSSIDTQDYATKHPNTVIYDSNWNKGNNNLWNSNKTMYDPCPAGWKVPDGGDKSVWSGMVPKSHNSLGVTIDPPYSLPSTYIPEAGRNNSYRIGYGGFYWNNNSHNNISAGCLYMWYGSEFNPTSWDEKCNMQSIRCQNIEMERFIIDEATIDYRKADKQAVISSSVTVTKSGKSYEKGYIYSTITTAPVLGNGTKYPVTSEEFTMTLNNLQSSTVYYITPYVICDGVVKYGHISQFITDAEGSGEDVTEDDDEYEW